MALAPLNQVVVSKSFHGVCKCMSGTELVVLIRSVCATPLSTERLGGPALVAIWCSKDWREKTLCLSMFSMMQRIRKSYQVGLESSAVKEERRGFLFHGYARMPLNAGFLFYGYAQTPPKLAICMKCIGGGAECREGKWISRESGYWKENIWIGFQPHPIIITQWKSRIIEFPF